MTETTTTFDDLVSAFDAWFDHDEDDVRDIAERFNTDIGGMLVGITEFWWDLPQLFDAAYEDEGSPLTMPHGAERATLVRQYGGDGGVSCCLVVFYVGSLKLATRAFEQRELCTAHETGRRAAAEALATLTAEIRKTLALTTRTNRLVELINEYGTSKFGDEWWPGNAGPYIGDERAEELNALLNNI